MSEDPDTIQIALVGLTGAGKTTSLTVLDHAMKQLGWEIFWLDDQTREYLLESFDDMIYKGIYPGATELEEQNRYLFQVKKAPSWISKIIQLNKRSFNVEIVDMAGQIYGRTEYANRGIFSEIATQCDGILFLVDPEKKWRKREDVHFGTIVKNAFTELRRHKVKRDMFVAFCVTKMDEGKRPHAWHVVEDFAREIVFDNQKVILTELDSFCNPHERVFCRWDACSSVGFKDDKIAEGMSRHKEDEDGHATIEDAGNLSPMGIGEAFEWLLKETGKKK